MSRYKLVSEWVDANEPEDFGPYTVQEADIQDTKSSTGYVYVAGAKRVVWKHNGKPAKVGKGGTVPYYGEFAWSDANRLARDLYWAHRMRRTEEDQYTL